MYEWLKYLHIVGGFLFVLAHGGSVAAAFLLRGQRDRARIETLLSLSAASVGIMYIGLVLLLVGGIAAAFVGSLWGRGWIWTSLAILAVIVAAMYVVATPFYGRMRAAAGIEPYGQQAGRYKPPATPADLEQLATSNRPLILALVGGIGLLAILYLMVFKPF
jgi:hypothetical protein